MSKPVRFDDRAAAGRALVPHLLDETVPPTVVLGVPHGGVVVAAPIARALAAPLCVAWVRKLVSPREPDVVLGAVDVDGDVTVATEIVRAEGLTDGELAELGYHAHQRLVADWERAPGLDAASLLPGATAVIVDDGLCTGLTLLAAIRWARRQGAKRVVVAVPVVDARVWHHVAASVEAAVTLDVREDGPIARSEVYADFRRVTDDDMAAILAEPGTPSTSPLSE
jgi:putative phosphoribosyl transferase